MTVDNSRPLRCSADPAAIRAWLRPAEPEPVDRMRPVPVPPWVVWGWGDGLTVDDPDLAGKLEHLVTEAQRAQVFGVPDHQVELWHVADNDGRLDGHLLVVRRPDGTGLASTHLSTDQLVDPDVSGVDAAVRVLANAAVTVDELLASGTHPTTSTTGPNHAARAFAAMRAVAVHHTTPLPDVEPYPPRVPADLARELHSLGESAYRYGDEPDEIRSYAQLAISAGWQLGWGDGGRIGVHAATYAVVRAAAVYVTTPEVDAAVRISDEAAAIWNTATALSTPRPRTVDTHDLTQAGASVVIHGTIAYHDAWYAGLREHATAVLDTLDEILDKANPTAPADEATAALWRQVRGEATNVIGRHRVGSPFHPPPAARAFPPLRPATASPPLAATDATGHPAGQHRRSR
jgi:hypothetical protein